MFIAVLQRYRTAPENRLLFCPARCRLHRWVTIFEPYRTHIYTSFSLGLSPAFMWSLSLPALSFFFLSSFFLVACTWLYTPLCPSVWHTLLFFYDFYFWTSLLLPKWSSDLKYGPYPPARNVGSRVYGLVLYNFYTFLGKSLCFSRSAM